MCKKGKEDEDSESNWLRKLPLEEILKLPIADTIQKEILILSSDLGILDTT